MAATPPSTARSALHPAPGRRMSPAMPRPLRADRVPPAPGLRPGLAPGLRPAPGLRSGLGGRSSRDPAWPRPSAWRTALIVACAAVAPRAAAPQVGVTTDILTGTVTGPDGRPLAGAVVEAISVETHLSRQRTTDARGRYKIRFPDGGGRYQLVVRFIGMAPAGLTVAREADQ